MHPDLSQIPQGLDFGPCTHTVIVPYTLLYVTPHFTKSRRCRDAQGGGDATAQARITDSDHC
eukprot:scaffold28444_cov68-Phaeocystis_antarctica.AAC.2